MKFFSTTCTALFLLAASAYAHHVWEPLTTLEAGRKAKEVSVPDPITEVRLVCESGIVTVNTIYVRGPNTRVTVAKQFQKGDTHRFSIPQDAVTSGLRISLLGKGNLRVDVKTVAHRDGKFAHENPGTQGPTKTAHQNLDREWILISDVSRKGGAIELKTDQKARHLKIVCTSGPVTVNTVVAREGGRKTPFTVATRFETDDSKEIDLKQTRQLTGLRISHGGPGSYSVYVKE